MKMIFHRLSVLAFYLIFNVVSADGESTNNTEIVLVHVIFRHGERTTHQFYPKDPHINETFYPIGLSGLTNNGKLMMFKLGEILRKNYGNLLGEDYVDEKIFARSTASARTKMSAMLVLAGLWPPSEKQNWHPSLKWQPIPIYSTPFLGADLLDPLYCKRQRQILNSLPKNSTVQDLFFKPHKELFSYVEQHSGLVLRDFQDLLQFYFTLKAESDYGLPLPDWTKSIYPEPLQGVASLVYEYTNLNPEVQKIQAGYLIQKLIDDSIAKANNTLRPKGRKMYLYAGYEETVANLMYALKVYKSGEVPPYGSTVIVEVHKQDTKHYLKLKYLRHPLTPDVQELKLPNCEQLCPLEKFVELQAHLSPTSSYYKACSIDHEKA